MDQAWPGRKPARPLPLTCSVESYTGLGYLWEERESLETGAWALSSLPTRWQKDIQKDTFSHRTLWLLLLPLVPGARIYLPSPACVEMNTLVPGALHDAASLAGLALGPYPTANLTYLSYGPYALWFIFLNYLNSNCPNFLSHQEPLYP